LRTRRQHTTACDWCYGRSLESSHTTRVLHVFVGVVGARRGDRMAGVLGVYGARGLTADRLGPIPHSPLSPRPVTTWKHGPAAAESRGSPLSLPTDKVRHVGEAGRDSGRKNEGRGARRGEAVEVSTRSLPWVTHSEDALEEGRRAVGMDQGRMTQRLVDTPSRRPRGDPNTHFFEADHVVKILRNFHIGRCTADPQPPRARRPTTRAPAGTRSTGKGGAVRCKKDLASLLGIEPRSLHVICRDVGGNFGSKTAV